MKPARTFFLTLALASAAATSFEAAAADTSRGRLSRDPTPAVSTADDPTDATPRHPTRHRAVPHRQVGKASIYAHSFANRKMANGRRMDPQGNNAASRTLPLGTRAQVTNLETGKSAEVTIQDRGPYVNGRIVDLSPKTAQQIGLSRHEGVATVEVKPLEVPPPRSVTDSDG